MNRAIPAIARATVRHVIHTRALAWLLFAACLPAIALPLTLKGDGSDAGLLTMILTYTPIAIFGIMLTGATWIGAFTLASERLQQQFAMLRTKPVSPAAIWAGKWLGVCFVNVLVLLLSGVAFYTTLIIRLQHMDPQLRIVWTAAQPDESGIRQRAQENLVRWQEWEAESGEAAPSLQQEINRLRQLQYRAGPGDTTTWRIPLDPFQAGRTDFRMRFRWQLDPMRRAPVSGTWSVTLSGETDPRATQAVSNLLDGNHEISWQDLSLTGDDRYLELQFAAAPGNEPVIFFDPTEPIVLLQAASTLPRNLWRAAIIACICCAAMAALTLLLSACFSFPVAVFGAHALLLALVVAAVGGTNQATSGGCHSQCHGHGGSWLLTKASHFLDTVYRATSGLRDTLPFRMLADNVVIHYHTRATTLLLLGLVVPLLCAWLAHLRISREEIPQ